MANGIPENSCSPPSSSGINGGTILGCRSGVLSQQSSFQSSSGSTPIQEVSSDDDDNDLFY